MGNVFYMTIEGTMFVLVIATYFYLRTRSITWPPAPQQPPYLTYGIASSALLLVSLLPARWAQRKAFVQDRPGISVGLFLMSLFGLALVVIRVFEFTALNCRWTDNAYASSIWILLGLHSGHLVTECIETFVVLGISFTDKMEGARIPDVAINSDYWYFVVITGLVCDFVIYASTRFV
jgi:heme/copper-type cytochrome/quinol oxidase subunit 3